MPMTPERAKEIVSAINDRAYFKMGLKEAPDIGSLEGVSLAEMLEAKNAVEAGNRAAQEHAKQTGGTYSVSIIPDDRLIAAAYALEHYQPDNEAVVVIPTSEWPFDRRALGVVGLEAGQGKEDE